MKRIPVKHAFNVSMLLCADRFVTKDWIPRFESFAHEMEALLGIKFRRVYGSKHEEIKSKSYVCIKRNEKKIRELLSRKLDDVSYELVEKHLYQMRDIDVYLRLARERPGARQPYHFFYLLIAPPILRAALGERSPQEFFLDLIRRVDKELINVRYGLVQPMDSRKLPVLYFSDIGSEYLTVLDRIRLKTWAEGNKEYQEKIWSVWWGNVITERHLGAAGEKVLKVIERFVGEGNVVEWDGGRYFFHLPVDVLRFEEEESRLLELSVKLEEMLEPYGVLMPRAKLSEGEIRFIERTRASRLALDAEREREQSQEAESDG